MAVIRPNTIPKTPVEVFVITDKLGENIKKLAIYTDGKLFLTLWSDRRKN